MTNSEIDRSGKFAALLAMTEVGLGSLLHAWQIPLSGHFLSLNQGFLLCKSAQSDNQQSALAPFRVSIAAAALKSLSPTGKRLTPMLAISMQGLLFTIGTLIAGSSFLGFAIGMMLLSLWAFAQPALLYFLVFGKSIVDVGQYFFESFQSIVPITYDQLLITIIAFLVAKLFVAIGIAYLAVTKSSEQSEKYFEQMAARFRAQSVSYMSHQTNLPLSQKLKLLGRDFMQPWFIGSLLMMTAFFFLTEPRGVTLTWYLLRPIAIGFIVFYTLRFLPVDRWINQACERFENPATLTLARALKYIKEDRGLKP